MGEYSCGIVNDCGGNREKEGGAGVNADVMEGKCRRGQS